MAKKKAISKNDIITWYMDYVLEHDANPKTVFAFSKLNNFEEAKFYEHFASFEAIEKGIFQTILYKLYKCTYIKVKTTKFLMPETNS